MLSEAITSAQHNNPDSLLALIEKFKPLLKKYAYKLRYEIVLSINLDAQNQKSEGALVNYICNSVKHAYCKRLKAVLDHPIQTFEFEASMNQISNLLMLPSCQDSSVFSLDIASILSEREYQTIVLAYKYQLSSAEIARKLHTTRQNVNQCKKRAEQKLRTYYEK